MDGFLQSRDGVIIILDLEEARYHEMLRKGEAAVKTALRELPQDAHNAPDEVLFRLAEERGLNPDMVVSIATKLGWKTSVRGALQQIWLLEMQREQSGGKR